LIRRRWKFLLASLALGAGAVVLVAYVSYEDGLASGDATTRAAAAPGLSLVRVASGFDTPTHVAAPSAEGNRLYVVEQGGRVYVLVNGRRRAEPFLDIRNLVQAGGEQGLLSIAFHPRYARNRRFYVDYTDTNGDTRVVEYRSDGTRALPGSARHLLFVDQPYSNHNGGQLAFGRDGALYVGMGDGGSGGDPENRAQNPRTLLGKLVRINVDRPAQRKIAALGLRNPWRFSFDRANGDLYIGDVGQNAWEEVDYLPRRRLGSLINYGWDAWEGRSRYEPKPLGPGRLVQPVAVYETGTSCSVTGGFVYRGRGVPAARGRYFYGDYCTGIVWSLRIFGAKARGLRRERFRVPGLSSFGEDARGELYLVGHQGGAIYRLAR
jgi:glucose/arabinose dehydrogenase